MLDTPFGSIEILIDGHHAEVDIIAKPIDTYWCDVEGAFRLRYVYHADGSAHRLSCLFQGDFQDSGAESGERLEMMAFYCGEGKLSIGVEGESYYDEAEDYHKYSYDFRVAYLINGLELQITPQTESQDFLFGVAWMRHCTDENDHQTWYVADPGGEKYQ